MCGSYIMSSHSSDGFAMLIICPFFYHLANQCFCTCNWRHLATHELSHYANGVLENNNTILKNDNVIVKNDNVIV